MAIEYFYTQNGQAAPTPVSAEQLRQLAASGQLLPTDMIWKEGMPLWVPASSLKGLFGSTRPPSGEVANAEARNLADKIAAAKAAPTTNPSLPAVTSTVAAANLAAPGLSPFLVLALTVITGGLFGVVYAALRPPEAAGQPANAAGRPLGRPRHPVRVAVLSYLTLGLYGAWWAHSILKECAAYLDRRDLDGRAELALLFAFPPYLVYVAAFRLPALVHLVRDKAGLPVAVGLNQGALFAFPIGWPALPLLGMAIQEALNEVWTSVR
jgi:hypothetical protein